MEEEETLKSLMFWQGVCRIMKEGTVEEMLEYLEKNSPRD